MKTKQNSSGTTRQQSTKATGTSQKIIAKGEKSRYVVGPGLIAAIKSCVRPSGGN